MLGDNIKTYRKNKGYSQETLAQELFVVRQTISKWEKGQSVPDADMLEKLAEALEVSVDDLLGKKTEEKKSKEESDTEIAKQLAILNEQLANNTRRRKKIIKIILISAALILIVSLILAFISGALYKYDKQTGYSITETIYCTIDGNEYVWEVTYDKEGNVISANGDRWIEDNIDPQQYKSAERQLKEIEEYITEHGGSFAYDE